MKKILFILILASSFYNSHAHASEEVSKTSELKKEIEMCSYVKADIARLECFDNFTKSLGLSADIGENGNWRVNVTVNPLNDSKTVSLVVDGSRGSARWNEIIYLIITCQDKETNLYISWSDYLGTKANVLTRIGNEEATSQEWLLSTDKKSSFYPTNVPDFIKTLFGNDKFVAQITPQNEIPVTASFDITGTENAIKPLRETCGW